MATIRASIPHEQRTAAEPRENQLEPVTLSHIREINESLRVLRLTPIDPNRTIQVCRLTSKECKFLLTEVGTVLTRPMARYIHTRSQIGRRIYHYKYP